MNKFQEYFEHFKKSNHWKEMNCTVENSPWHREKNVAVHTEMVLREYATWFLNSRTETEQLVSQIALLFHDVGKPEAEETLEKKDSPGDMYRRYSGHEQISAVAFQEEYVQCKKLQALLTIKQARAVRWIIEHHLPYSMKDIQKRSALAKATFAALEEANCSYDVFFDCLRSDAAGRISDDHETKLRNVEEWISEFKIIPNTLNPIHTSQTMVFLIGPAGSGKSTYIRNRFNPDVDAIVSMDELKLEFLDLVAEFATYASDAEKYSIAWKYANDNEIKFKAFAMTKAKNIITNLSENGIVYIDITNLSKKRRAVWVDMGRKKNKRMRFEAVEFWNSINTLVERQNTRQDKTVPASSVHSQVKAQTCAWIGTEADSVKVIVGPSYTPELS